MFFCDQSNCPTYYFFLVFNKFTLISKEKNKNKNKLKFLTLPLLFPIAPHCISENPIRNITTGNSIPFSINFNKICVYLCKNVSVLSLFFSSRVQFLFSGLVK